MDNLSDNKLDLKREDPDSPEEAGNAGATRRRFTRSSVIGGAVLLSLGNRAAWGLDNDCVSEGTWTSYTTPTLGWASAIPAENIDQNEKRTRAEDIYAARGGPEYGYEVDLDRKPPNYACFPPAEGDLAEEPLFGEEFGKSKILKQTTIYRSKKKP